MKGHSLNIGVEGSIEDRVREYLPRLRELQPHGPYVLVGWSFGGALAYGVAQLLREAGEDRLDHPPVGILGPADRMAGGAHIVRIQVIQQQGALGHVVAGVANEDQ